MKRFIRIATPMICLIGVVSCSAKNEKKEVTKLETEVEKYSYMVGQDMGKSLKDLNTEFDLSALMKGVEDILKDNKSLLSDAERESLQVAFSKKLRSEHENKMSELGKKNTKEGKEFLEKNKKNKDVKTTKSGLQYKVLKKGDGPKPTAEDVVTVHYKGTLLDGTEFDSSYKRGEPATFPVKGVIPGWTEALQLMNVGSKYKLFIPSELAYGARGAGPQIAPNSVLIFEVELISIKDEQKKEAPKAKPKSK